mmetsp:Transcript_2967/g.9088  ORF Transcript_2967/g.9088 Transcript_2967/m.9088 type:complete len:216 (+) Transcript_2967:598-1245(+)
MPTAPPLATAAGAADEAAAEMDSAAAGQDAAAAGAAGFFAREPLPFAVEAVGAAAAGAGAPGAEAGAFAEGRRCAVGLALLAPTAVVLGVELAAVMLLLDALVFVCPPEREAACCGRADAGVKGFMKGSPPEARRSPWEPRGACVACVSPDLARASAARGASDRGESGLTGAADGAAPAEGACLSPSEATAAARRAATRTAAASSAADENFSCDL